MLKRLAPSPDLVRKRGKQREFVCCPKGCSTCAVSYCHRPPLGPPYCIPEVRFGSRSCFSVGEPCVAGISS